MRQVGILASACLVALTRAKENLTKDHANAKKLAEGIEKSLKAIPEAQDLLSVDSKSIQTNIVHLSILSDSLTPVDIIKRLTTV